MKPMIKICIIAYLNVLQKRGERSVRILSNIGCRDITNDYDLKIKKWLKLHWKCQPTRKTEGNLGRCKVKMGKKKDDLLMS